MKWVAACVAARTLSSTTSLAMTRPAAPSTPPRRLSLGRRGSRPHRADAGDTIDSVPGALVIQLQEVCDTIHDQLEFPTTKIQIRFEAEGGGGCGEVQSILQAAKASVRSDPVDANTVTRRASTPPCLRSEVVEEVRTKAADVCVCIEWGRREGPVQHLGRRGWLLAQPRAGQGKTSGHFQPRGAGVEGSESDGVRRRR